MSAFFFGALRAASGLFRGPDVCGGLPFRCGSGTVLVLMVEQ